MKNLIIVRHAKSSWNAPLQDFDRPLEQRGIDDANLVAVDFVKHLPSNFVMHSSSAKRARQTASIFANAFSYSSDRIIFRDDLYTFDEDKLEKVIKSIGNDFDNVILFGHNEAITNFVNKFGDISTDNVPTSGLIWLQFETTDWAKINKCITKKTIFPKNLK